MEYLFRLIKTSDSSILKSCSCQLINTEVHGEFTFSDYSNPGYILINWTILKPDGSTVSGTSGPIATAEPWTITTDDVVLQYPGKYTFHVEVEGYDGENAQVDAFVFEEDIDVCRPDSITTTACGTYVFENPLPVTVLLNIYNAFNGELVLGDISVLNGATYEFDLTTPGLYYIEYAGGESSVLYKEYFSYHCTIEACIAKLISKILCHAEEDPCCKECNDSAKTESEMDRLELNKILALFGYYLSMYDQFQEDFYVRFTMEESDITKAAIDVSTLLQKIIDLTTRCKHAGCTDTVSIVNCGCS